ncbi:MAG: phosphoadenosine phosphosulfate reductase family protein [Methylococcaceae bacterium]|jgi:3'-phosphoadenosine 5'-phosphosulfate sulfotransferase (PAPS reductase)/FAD synthetase
MKKETENKIKIVVPISGGKDSQACLKLALMEYDKNEVLGLFCDTQFEHPITYAHIDKMRDMYGVKIERICAGSVPGEVLKAKRFPGGGARHCTDRLKLRPSRDFYKALAEKQGGFEVWLGMRSDESKEREKRYSEQVNNELYAPNDIFSSFPKYLNKMGVWFKLPVLDWTTQDVFNLLDGEENPLYSMGSSRVGCFPCLASGDRNKERDFAMDDFGRSQRVIVSELEKQIGRSIFTSKCGAMRNNENQSDIFTGCAICAM